MKRICVFDDVKIRIWQCKDTGTMNRPLRLAECFVAVFGVFVAHSRNVCNAFAICTLHIRKTKVWFLPCKSMVFGVQKGGFCIAKVWFLFFECYVVANWSHAFRGWMWIFCGVFAILFQFASRVISRPLAAVWDRFIAPAYPYISTKWGTEMCLRWNEYTYLIMGKYGFGKGKIRARWIGPLRLAVCSWEIS